MPQSRISSRFEPYAVAKPQQVRSLPVLPAENIASTVTEATKSRDEKAREDKNQKLLALMAQAGQHARLWDDLVGLPSRLTAPTAEQAERSLALSKAKMI